MAVLGKNLSIFQKTLVAPLVGLVLYSLYLGFSHAEYQNSRRILAGVRDSYLPVLELTGENLILFNAIVDDLKDAVLAGESDWISNTRSLDERLEANLRRLGGYTTLVSAAEISTVRAKYRAYYDNAVALSLAMLGKRSNDDPVNRLIEDVTRFHGEAQQAFENQKLVVQHRLSAQLDESDRGLRLLLWVGIGLGILLILLMSVISFVLSLSTRRSLAQVNHALKNIAQDHPDFSARLVSNRDDELGELVGWFNLLSEKLEQDYKKIEQLSITDKLTQLYNRAKIDELLAMELHTAARYRQPLSLIMLDLDYFKTVNDAHGHQVGDAVLQELSTLLRNNVRNCDHLGRWGGEEFVVIAPHTDLIHARQLADKLRAAIAAHEFDVAGHKTASFGVACSRPGESDDSLSARADQCLYRAKTRGRNQVVDESELS